MGIIKEGKIRNVSQVRKRLAGGKKKEQPELASSRVTQEN